MVKLTNPDPFLQSYPFSSTISFLFLCFLVPLLFCSGLRHVIRDWRQRCWPSCPWWKKMAWRNVRTWIIRCIWLGYAALLSHSAFYILAGFPVTVVQKLKEVCEASSETCSSLHQCLGLFSKQEGVCTHFTAHIHCYEATWRGSYKRLLKTEPWHSG